MTTEKFVFRRGRVLAAILSLAATDAMADATSRYSVTTGVDYSSGKYGSSTDTEMWYLPVTLKYETGPSTFKMTVSYIRMQAPATGATIIGYDAQGLPIYSGGSGRRVIEGQGDTLLSYTHNLTAKPYHRFLVDVGAKVKLPTAENHLGSGKTDYGVYTDVYYLSGAVTPFFSVGYRVLGDPAGINLRNVWQGTVGVAYKLSNQNSLGAMWDLRQATTSSSEGINELTGFWVHKFSDTLKLQAYGMAGFSNVSPDYGAGLMITAYAH